MARSDARSAVRHLSIRPLPQSPFNRVYDELLEEELEEHEAEAIWVTKQAAFPEIRARIEAAGFTVTPLAPYRDRAVFRVTGG